MKLVFSPQIFNLIAVNFQHFRWRVLAWSAFSFILFLLLQTQITQSTPSALIWLALFILYIAFQTLVFSAFIFFFQQLRSNMTVDKQWISLYRIIEWCEASLFFVLLPLPTLVFLYAIYTFI